MSEETGGSFLSEAATAAQPVENGTPAAVAMGTAPAKGVEPAQDEIPDWVPKKYWDAEKKSARVEDLGRSYINLEKLLGREKIPIPVDDNDEEGWQRWYNAAGRPETPDKYEFQRPELPPELPYDEDTEKAFRAWSHSNGLSKKQAKNLYDGFVKKQIEHHAGWAKEQQQRKAEREAGLQREHGAKLESVKAQAGSAMREFADPEFHEFLNESQLGNDPRMIRFMVKVGAKMQGETRLKGAPPSAPDVKDYNTAIADFRERHKDALFNRDHPNHALRVQEYTKLFQGAHGDDPANRF